MTRVLVLRLIGAGLLAVATEAAGIGLVGTATWLIVRAAEQPPLAALSVAIVAVRALALAKGSLRYLERLAGHDAVLRVLVDLRARVFTAIVAGRSSARSADLLSRVVSDVDGVQDAILRCYLPAAVATVVGAGAVAVTLTVSAFAGLILLLGLVVGGLLLPYLGDRLSRASAGRIAAARADVVTAAVDVVHGAADLAAFGALPAFLADAADRNARLARLEARSGAIAGVVGAVAAVVPAGLAIALAGFGPVLALVALAVGEVVVPLAGAAVHHAGLRGAFARLSPLLRSHPLPFPPPAPGSADIDVRDAVVRYHGDGRPALDHVSLHVPLGTRVAVIGPSGSGKSTLLGVLAGQVPLGAGTVEGLTPGWPAVGGVLADAHVFHASVRENVLLGRSHLNDEDAGRALTAAGLPDWTDRLDRIVGEDGAEVSGGQRQRLLLARALVEMPSVLLLDEPTEGLDPATADAVLDAALAAAGTRTVMVVTHRHAHLTRFDLVIALAEGRRVPIGVIPEELTLGGMRS
jgi:ATP-binding cassette subfamily C protein CydC